MCLVCATQTSLELCTSYSKSLVPQLNGMSKGFFDFLSVMSLFLRHVVSKRIDYLESSIYVQQER